MMDGRTDGCGDGGVSKTATVRLLIVVRKAATSKKGSMGMFIRMKLSNTDHSSHRGNLYLGKLF